MSTVTTHHPYQQARAIIALRLARRAVKQLAAHLRGHRCTPPRAWSSDPADRGPCLTCLLLEDVERMPLLLEYPISTLTSHAPHQDAQPEADRLHRPLADALDGMLAELAARHPEDSDDLGGEDGEDANAADQPLTVTK